MIVNKVIIKLSKNCKQFSKSVLQDDNAAKILYKHLIRQCNKLPKGPKEHYKFMIKQVKKCET